MTGEMFGEYRAHEAAEWFPMLDDDALAELSEDIARRGQDEPCVTWRGLLVDGRNRWRACEMAGVVPATEERDFESEEACVDFIFAVNVHRRHLTAGQKAGVAIEWKKNAAERAEARRVKARTAQVRYENERGTTAAEDVAGKLGVSTRTVENAFRAQKEGVPELVEAMKRDDISTRAAADISRMPHEAQRAVLAAPEEIRREAVKALREDPSMAAEIAADVIDTVEAKRPHLAINSGNDEWYTPREYVDMARDVMGDIDLDPASNDMAQKWVQASTYYTKERSGLDEVWAGRVWMNPPYSRDLMMRFCSKFCGHVASREITAGVVLTNNSGDTAWWQMLAFHCSALCQTNGRVRFKSPSQEKSAPTQGQTFFYFGEDVDLFSVFFSKIGSVLVPYVEEGDR